MKILRITLENMASLEGRHTVDFTRDPLRSTGLYSIIGPTGAGKSTLLDALCLSLYEDTPRLHAIKTKTEKLSEGETQKDPRVLLRRGASSGFAETAFVGVDGQTYTARWSVRRARNKAEGALQKAELALYSGNIAPGEDGTLLEGGKKTDVAAAIEQRIGLTFPQFTRAVMLAQNDFAAFLKTDDKERAAILEALTGTEAFTKISKAVFLRCSDEEKKLKEIELQLVGNTPLADEARADAEKNRDDAKRILEDNQQQLNSLRTTLVWFTQLSKLESERTDAQEKYTQAVDLENAAAPRKAEAELSQRVLFEAPPLRIPHQKAEADCRDAEKTLADRSNELCNAETTQLQTTTACEQAQAHVTELTTAQTLARPALDLARQLDAVLPEFQQNYDRTRQKKIGAAGDEKAANEKLQEKTEELRKTTDRRNELQRLLDSERLKPVVPLSARAEYWIESLRQLEKDIEKHRATDSDLQKNNRQLATLQLELQQYRKEEFTLSEQHAQAKQKLQHAIEAEQQIDVDALNHESTQLTATRDLVIGFQYQVEKYLEVQNDLQTTSDELQQRRQQEAQLLQQVEADRNQRVQAEADLTTAQEMLEQIRAAIDDHSKRLRTLLRDNHPCPVCGSESHPWNQHEPDFDSVALKTAQEQVKQRQKRLKEAVGQWSQLEADVAQCGKDIRRLEDSEATDQRSLQNFPWKNPDAPAIAPLLLLPPQERIAAIRTTVQQLENSSQSLQQQQQALRKLQQDRSQCQEIVDNMDMDLRKLQKQVMKLELSENKLTEALKLLKPQAASERSTIADQEQKLNELWSAFPEGQSLFQTNPAELREDLQQRFSDCLQYGDESRTATAKIAGLHETCSDLEQAHKRAAEQLTGIEAEYQRAKLEWEENSRERETLFAGRPVADVEAEFTQALAEANARLTSAIAAKTTAEAHRTNAITNQANAIQAVETARLQLTQCTQQLDAWLEAVTITLTQPLTIERVDAILKRGSAWLQAEQNAFETLKNGKMAAQNEVETLERRRCEHVATRPTELDEQAVQLQKQEQEATVAGNEEQLKQAEVPLIVDDENRSRNQKLSIQLAERSRTAAPWQKLNELVGSSDGTKFSRIAQTITLDLLLKDANYQLSNLSPRYRMERLGDSLNLLIIDREMGDERRSVHSLSGGESFLVSLALALALAALTSNRMRIESLFIDEGFGSLDEDTLALAMNALMHLEAQGRKVGIITHVTQMKDVIPVQIQVRKTKGGASAIHIPGGRNQHGS